MRAGKPIGTAADWNAPALHHSMPGDGGEDDAVGQHGVVGLRLGDELVDGNAALSAHSHRRRVQRGVVYGDAVSPRRVLHWQCLLVVVREELVLVTVAGGGGAIAIVNGHCSHNAAAAAASGRVSGGGGGGEIRSG